MLPHLLPILAVLLCPGLCSASLSQGLTTPPNPRSLPNAEYTTDPAIFTLDPNFNITNVPSVREYWWDLTAVQGAPDGYTRQMFVVNGQFPGPLTEANEGDTIIAHVNNYLDHGQAIHWHGMLMNGTAAMDGVPGFTQCPIPPGGDFTYTFKVDNQFGTYWWHSHYGNTMADGLVGALIVHSPRDPLKLGEHYDEERILYLMDWMHDESHTIIDALLGPSGYRGIPAPPEADAILVNGVVHVPVGKRVRFRIINMGSHENFLVSIDSHQFEVVEADDTPIYGPTTTHVQIAPAQRYSIIVQTDQGKVGDAFWLRTAPDTGCLGPGAKQDRNLLIFRYVDDNPSHSPPSTQRPQTKAWTAFDSAAYRCESLDILYNLTPRNAINAPTEVLQTNVLASSFGRFTDISGARFFGFEFNNVHCQNQIYYPLLAQIQDGHSVNTSLVATATFDQVGGADFVINNLDAGLTHPYHLHGRPFFIVARGTGRLSADDVPHIQVDTVNPLRRDTIQVPGGTYAVLRLITDDPGIWGLHCHIGWHLAQGKLAAVIIRPDVVKTFPKPPGWEDMCTGYDPNAIGPAKRLVDPRRSRQY